MTSKKRLLAAMLLMASGTAAFAQNADNECNKDYKPYPYLFFGVQGGVESTLTNYSPIDLTKLTGAVSFGSYFTPAVGARLNVSGWRNKGIFRNPDHFYKYKYITSDIDLLLNLTNIFASKKCNVVNVVLIGGIGLNYAWDDLDVQAALANNPAYNAPRAWKSDFLSHNLRVGVQLDFNIAKHWGANLEVNANSLSDRYNSKTNNRDDWQVNALVGLTYKFGFKPKGEAEPVVLPKPALPEVWETRKDTVWYNDVSYKTVTVPNDKIERNVYYSLRSSDTENKELNDIVNFVKTHKDCKVKITAYADRGTGNPKLNMGYSKNRAQSVKQALVNAGVDESIITAEWLGDTVQPFAENDKNRVAITVATGTGEKQERVETKKYRIEDKKVRVQ